MLVPAEFQALASVSSCKCSGTRTCLGTMWTNILDVRKCFAIRKSGNFLENEDFMQFYGCHELFVSDKDFDETEVLRTVHDIYFQPIWFFILKYALNVPHFIKYMQSCYEYQTYTFPAIVVGKGITFTAV